MNNKNNRKGILDSFNGDSLTTDPNTGSLDTNSSIALESSDSYKKSSLQAFCLAKAKELGAVLDGTTNDGPALQSLINYFQGLHGKQNIDFSMFPQYIYTGSGLVFNADKFADINLGGKTYWSADSITQFRFTGESDNTKPQGAVVTASVVGGAVQLTVVSGGNYTYAPAVTITGDGTGASFTSIIDRTGTLTGFTGTGGSGYTTATVTIRKTPFGQTVCVFRNFVAVGPGYTSTAKCIQLNQPSGTNAIDPGPSGIKISDFFIRGYNTGIDHFSHSYAEMIEHGSISSCYYGSRRRYGASDSGELTYYHKVMFSGCIYCIECESGTDKAMMSGSWYKYNACHFDYSSVTVFARQGAKISLNDCHMEGDATNTAYATTAIFNTEDPGTIIYIRGGQLVYPTVTNRQIAYFCNAANPITSGGIFFDGVDMYGSHTTTGDFATGTGTVIRRNCTTMIDRPNAVVTSRTINACADGKPTLSTFADVIQIRNDNGAAITDPHTGSNITIVNASNAAPYPSGISRGWRIAKIGNSTTTASFAFLVPIGDSTDIWGGSFQWRKSVAGNITITPIYASARSTGTSGLLEIAQQVAASPTITITTTNSPNWTRLDAPITARLNKIGAGLTGATHYGFLFDLNSMNAFNFDVCDFWFGGM